MTEDTTILTPNRPEPVKTENEPLSAFKNTSADLVAKTLLAGEFAVIGDEFPTGLKVLSELKKRVFSDDDDDDFLAYRNKQSLYHQASNRLLVPIKNNNLELKKAPSIGWIKELYPDVKDFLIPFPQVQGLNSSWQWYKKGIKYPVLESKLHPFYGTYFPTRFDHLYLFDYWLKKYAGTKSTAIDIGTGCGVLAFQMLNRGFEKVYATDINPNAIISAGDDAKRLDLDDRLEVWQSDLFQNVQQKTDLILFNPPWVPMQSAGSGLDRAIYYEPELFSRFFDEASNHVNRNGRIVILFSNFAQVAGFEQEHPIESELRQSDRYKKVIRIKRKAAKPSKKSKRRDNRKGEYVELWELEVSVG